MLLLTGPTGVGKTAAIYALANELKCEVQEWSNPATDSYDSSLASYLDNRGTSRTARLSCDLIRIDWRDLRLTGEIRSLTDVA